MADLERKLGENDEAIQQIVLALKDLMTPNTETKPKRRIGFHLASDENPRAKKKS